MTLNLKKLIDDVFAPQTGEVLTIMHDVPHDQIKDTLAWKDRREMAAEWQKKIAAYAMSWDIIVNPLVVYEATGVHNADLPPKAAMGGQDIPIEKIFTDSSIVICLSEFSATALLRMATLRNKNLRIASMPTAARFMEETGLSADYGQIAKKCRTLMPLMTNATGIEVEFSTGHKCFFDLSTRNAVHKDDGVMHQEVAGTESALCNLPAGEVFTTPNEEADSKTAGEIPEMIEGKVVVYTVKHNKIITVKGEGSGVIIMREYFEKDPARRNIAEVAIGCNDRATVTGNLLQDEKAGFHWAYGRSDHIAGKVGPKEFLSPANVVHMDIVYSKDSPIVCKKFDFVYPDNIRKTAIVDGKLLV